MIRGGALLSDGSSAHIPGLSANFQGEAASNAPYGLQAIGPPFPSERRQPVARCALASRGHLSTHWCWERLRRRSRPSLAGAWQVPARTCRRRARWPSRRGDRYVCETPWIQDIVSGLPITARTKLDDFLVPRQTTSSLVIALRYHDRSRPRQRSFLSVQSLAHSAAFGDPCTALAHQLRVLQTRQRATAVLSSCLHLKHAEKGSCTSDVTRQEQKLSWAEIEAIADAVPPATLGAQSQKQKQDACHRGERLIFNFNLCASEQGPRIDEAARRRVHGWKSGDDVGIVIIHRGPSVMTQVAPRPPPWSSIIAAWPFLFTPRPYHNTHSSLPPTRSARAVLVETTVSAQ